jgi:hypothetical protein
LDFRNALFPSWWRLSSLFPQGIQIVQLSRLFYQDGQIFYFPAPLSRLGELPIDRLLVFQDPIPAAGAALLRARDAQSKFGATQGHDGDTVTLGLSFDGSMGLFRRPVASRKKMRIKGGVTTKQLRRNASTRYLFPSVKRQERQKVVIEYCNQKRSMAFSQSS